MHARLVDAPVLPPQTQSPPPPPSAAHYGRSPSPVRAEEVPLPPPRSPAPRVETRGVGGSPSPTGARPPAPGSVGAAATPPLPAHPPPPPPPSRIPDASSLSSTPRRLSPRSLAVLLDAQSLAAVRARHAATLHAAERIDRDDRSDRAESVPRAASASASTLTSAQASGVRSRSTSPPPPWLPKRSDQLPPQWRAESLSAMTTSSSSSPLATALPRHLDHLDGRGQSEGTNVLHRAIASGGAGQAKSTPVSSTATAWASPPTHTDDRSALHAAAAGGAGPVGAGPVGAGAGAGAWPFVLPRRRADLFPDALSLVGMAPPGSATERGSAVAGPGPGTGRSPPATSSHATRALLSLHAGLAARRSVSPSMRAASPDLTGGVTAANSTHPQSRQWAGPPVLVAESSALPGGRHPTGLAAAATAIGDDDDDDTWAARGWRALRKQHDLATRLAAAWPKVQPLT